MSLFYPMVDDDAPVACARCNWSGIAGQAYGIQNAGTRLTAGETVPAGECPTCASLVHLKVDPDADVISRILEEDLTFEVQVEHEKIKNEKLRLVNADLRSALLAIRDAFRIVLLESEQTTDKKHDVQ